MINALQFELVTPEESLFSREIVMAVMPGAEGEFGVLAGHSPLISTLKPGVIKVYVHDDKSHEDVFVTGGVAHVDGHTCVVLAHEAIPAADLNITDAEARLSKAKNAQEEAKNDSERERAEQDIEMAQAMIDAVKGTH